MQLNTTIAQVLAGVHDAGDRQSLRTILQNIADRLTCVTFQSAALRIKGGSASAIVQSNAVWSGLVQGIHVTKATSTDMAALVGTVTNAKFNVFFFFIDSAGTLTSAMGTEGATLAAVVPPPIPIGKTVIGYITINPTGTGNFVGGTTALDDATVVPTAVFVNTIGPFDPTLLPGPYSA